jgi:hypothetical protein
MDVSEALHVEAIDMYCAVLGPYHNNSASAVLVSEWVGCEGMSKWVGRGLREWVGY